MNNDTSHTEEQQCSIISSKTNESETFQIKEILYCSSPKNGTASIFKSPKSRPTHFTPYKIFSKNIINLLTETCIDNKDKSPSFEPLPKNSDNPNNFFLNHSKLYAKEHIKKTVNRKSEEKICFAKMKDNLKKTKKDKKNYFNKNFFNNNININNNNEESDDDEMSNTILKYKRKRKMTESRCNCMLLKNHCLDGKKGECKNLKKNSLNKRVSKIKNKDNIGKVKIKRTETFSNHKKGSKKQSLEKITTNEGLKLENNPVKTQKNFRNYFTPVSKKNSESKIINKEKKLQTTAKPKKIYNLNPLKIILPCENLSTDKNDNSENKKQGKLYDSNKCFNLNLYMSKSNKQNNIINRKYLEIRASAPNINFKLNPCKVKKHFKNNTNGIENALLFPKPKKTHKKKPKNSFKKSHLKKPCTPILPFKRKISENYDFRPNLNKKDKEKETNTEKNLNIIVNESNNFAKSAQKNNTQNYPETVITEFKQKVKRRNSMTILNQTKNEQIDLFNNKEKIDDVPQHMKDCLKIILDIDPLKQPRCKLKVNFNFNENDKRKIALFDLDETLVHCTGEINISNIESYSQKCDTKLEIILPGNKKVTIGLNIRPKWKESLIKLKQKYHVIAYTASHQAYADTILDFLDPNKNIFEYRLYRNNCVQCNYEGTKFYVKDLDILNEKYDLKNVVIIDNSILSFVFHLYNGIPIFPYYQGVDDEMERITECLLSIADEDDLREELKKIVKIDDYLKMVEEEIKEESSDLESDDEEEVEENDKKEDNKKNINKDNNENNKNNDDSNKENKKNNNKDNNENNNKKNNENNKNNDDSNIKYNKEACSKKDVTRLSLSKKTRNYTFNSSSKILSIKEDVIEGIKGKNEEKKDKNKNE